MNVNNIAQVARTGTRQMWLFWWKSTDSKRVAPRDVAVLRGEMLALITKMFG